MCINNFNAGMGYDIMCEDDAGTLFEYYYSYTDDEAQNVFTETELYNLEFALYDVTYETAQNAFIAGYKAARDEIPQL